MTHLNLVALLCAGAFGGSGFVQIPRTIGFRLIFRPEKSGIASGVSPHPDFTWEPLP